MSGESCLPRSQSECSKHLHQGTRSPDWIPAYTASTQTSTTSTRTSTTTTSTTTMPFKERPVSDGPSMYCFMVARMTGDEGDLVKCQFRRGAGIFGCNHFSVFSDTRFLFTLGPPVVQTYQLPLPVSTPMHVAGVETAGYLNTELFVRVWERLMGLPQVWSHDWIVKVDPDTVFFPYRLQRSLVHYGQGVAAYLRNCPGGPRGLEMFGAMEVISSRGLDAYRAGWTQCVERLQWNELGEDPMPPKCLDLLNPPPPCGICANQRGGVRGRVLHVAGRRLPRGSAGLPPLQEGGVLLPVLGAVRRHHAQPQARRRSRRDLRSAALASRRRASRAAEWYPAAGAGPARPAAPATSAAPAPGAEAAASRRRASVG
ncbi:unnamed protein product, partial [Prorocentrum cordatum]